MDLITFISAYWRAGGTAGLRAYFAYDGETTEECYAKALQESWADKFWDWLDTNEAEMAGALMRVHKPIRIVAPDPAEARAAMEDAVRESFERMNDTDWASL